MEETIKDIFEGVKFGDKFVTRGDKVALYIDSYEINNKPLVELITTDRVFITVSEKSGFVDYENNISQNDDIISRYQEPINEEEVINLALANYEECLCAEDGFFKAGYSKAKEG